MSNPGLNNTVSSTATEYMNTQTPWNKKFPKIRSVNNKLADCESWYSLGLECVRHLFHTTFISMQKELNYTSSGPAEVKAVAIVMETDPNIFWGK